MVQVHKRFSDEQVKMLFQGYCQGVLSRADVQDLPGIGRSRFRALRSACRRAPDAFSL